MRTVSTGTRSTSSFRLVVGLACGVLLGAIFVTGNEEPLATGAGQAVRAGDQTDLVAEGGDESDGPETGGDGGESSGPAPRRSGAGGPGGDTGGSESGATGGEGPAAEGGPGGVTGGDAAPTNVRGVSDDSIRIGVGIPDVGPFAAASEQFDVGDVQQQMEAVLDRWRREGLVPVHGRDVEFVYRTFSIFGTDEQIAACNGFVKDDKVFMVIGMRSFEAGAECLASRFQTPVIELGTFVSDDDFARRHPYQFTIRTSMSRLARNFAHWAERAGALDGATIGLYSTNDPVTSDMAANLEAELERLGHEIEAKASTDSTFAGQQDVVAVQQFRNAQVDLAILLVGVLPAANFMENAESQLYRPTYVGTDYQDHTSDAGSSTFPASQYDGTLAMTQTRTGEIASGKGLTAKAEACLANYERFSGDQVERRSPESAEMANILQVCDDAEPVLLALQGAGRGLGVPSFIAALEGVGGLEMAAHGAVAFHASKHHGMTQQRTIRWSGDCSCWSAVSDFTSFFVP